MSLGSKIGSVARLTLTFTGCYVVGKSLMRSILGISNSKNSELISMLPTDTRSTFAKLAKTYDRRIQEEEEGEILTIRKNVMNYAYGNVLEVAAGTCRDLPYYDATKVTSLTCADAVPEMLEQGYMIARQHLRRVLGLPKPSTKPIDPNDQDNPEVIKKLKMERKAIKEQVDSVLNDWVMAKSPQEIVDMISKANADGMDAVGDSSLTSSKYPLPHPFNVKPSMTNPGPSTSTGHGSPETSSSSPLSFLPQFGSPPPSVAGSQSPSTSSKQVVTSTTKRVAFPIYFTQVDAMDLRAFPENSFDTVVDTFGLCSIADAERALLEMQRVCKPDGRIILLGTSSHPIYICIAIPFELHFISNLISRSPSFTYCLL